MDGFLMVGMRVMLLLLSFLLSVLLVKTFEHFNTLHERVPAKPAIAWDLIVLFGLLIYLLVKLVTM